MSKRFVKSRWGRKCSAYSWTTQRAALFQSRVCTGCCFSATGSYVLSHFPLDNPSLHKTCNQLSGYSEGTQCLSSNTVTSAHWGRALERGRQENPALLFSARTARSEHVVCKRGGRVRGGGGGSMQAGLITYIDSGAVLKACYTRLFPGLAQLLSFWTRGKTCKQWNNMQVQCTAVKWRYLHRKSLKIWNLCSESCLTQVLRYAGHLMH